MVKNIIQEYYTWQNPDKPGQFSYCQYPFILSIVAKRHILTKVIIILHILNYDNDNDNCQAQVWSPKSKSQDQKDLGWH